MSIIASIFLNFFKQQILCQSVNYCKWYGGNLKRYSLTSKLFIVVSTYSATYLMLWWMIMLKVKHGAVDMVSSICNPLTIHDLWFQWRAELRRTMAINYRNLTKAQWNVQSHLWIGIAAMTKDNFISTLFKDIIQKPWSQPFPKALLEYAPLKQSATIDSHHFSLSFTYFRDSCHIHHKFTA